MNKTMIYLITEGRSGPFKLGISTNPAKRMATLQTGNPRELRQLQPRERRYEMSTTPKSRTPEYNAWINMRRRCINASHPQFKDYGGRGITVCDRWLHSFDSFLEDMGLRPSPKHSIDRVNNDGPYSPSNCRWATQRAQMQNTRRSKLITVRGETACLTEWARRTGIGVNTISERLRRGWSHERAVTESPHPLCPHCGMSTNPTM
jgi:hypothetical protein